MAPDRLPKEPERLKWFVWHGNVFRDLQIVEILEMDLEIAQGLGPEHRKLLKAVREFDTYLQANAESIPDYGELHSPAPTVTLPLIPCG